MRLKNSVQPPHAAVTESVQVVTPSMDKFSGHHVYGFDSDDYDSLNLNTIV